jgi:hypothetical protein
VSSSGLADGLGRRWLAFDREEGTMLERLVVRPELAAFEALLRDRIDRLAVLDDERIARPRTLLREPSGSLVAVSEFVPGIRLSEILETAEIDGAAPGVDAALGFLLDTLPALCCLHAGAGFAHGTIAPSRIVATPAGQIVLLDAIYGEALSRLRLSRRPLWTEFGLAVRPVSGPAALDAQTDVAQAVLGSVMLILGRQIQLPDLVAGLSDVLGEINDIAQIRGTEAFAQRLCHFVQRALPFFTDPPFETADDALIEVRELAAEIGSAPQCQMALHEYVGRLTPERDIQPGEGGLEADDEESPDDEIVDEEIDLDAIAEEEDDEPYCLNEPVSLEEPFALDGFRGRGEIPAAREHAAAPVEAMDELHAAHPDRAALDAPPATLVGPDESRIHEEWIALTGAADAAPQTDSVPEPDTVHQTDTVAETGAVRPIDSLHRASAVHQVDAVVQVEAIPRVDVVAAAGSPEPVHQADSIRIAPEFAPAEVEVPPHAVGAVAQSSPAAPAPESVREVRSRRAKRARSARARKDKLRSARATPPAAATAALPADAEPQGGGWLVRPDRVPVFDPAPEPPAPPSHVVPFPVPAAVPTSPRPAVHAIAPRPPAVLYPPVPPPAAVPAVSFPVTPPPPVTSGIPPPYAPWSASPPMPAPPGTSGAPLPTVKLKTAPKARRANRSSPADDIYGTPLTGPRAEPPPRFPWRLAAAVVAVILVAVIAGRAYMPGRSVPDDESGAAAAIAAAAAATPPFVPPAAPTGRLEIETQPAGARVLLNGQPAGQTPVTLDAVPAGRHTVTLVTGSGSVRRTVRVDAGRTARLDVPIFSGWVAVFAPFTVEVSAGGRVVGTTDDPRILLSPGRHELTLRNRALGYHAVQAVDIEPGQVRTVTLDPRGQASFNATPWAEVWIDGQKAGDTPIANLKLPLGTREVVFRHPQLGERRTTVTITASTPSAVSMDMSRR